MTLSQKAENRLKPPLEKGKYLRFPYLDHYRFGTDLKLIWATVFSK